MVGLSGNAQPVPFFVAASILAKWVTAEERKTEETASRATVRVQVRPGGFLAWLRAQKLKEKVRLAGNTLVNCLVIWASF